jgi:pyruvate/2-oxoglutarate dehydrogenase complex dihydrolipoamide acyltransferase (E2) component
MLMKLEMPLIDPSLRGGSVLKWLKREGEAFAFGEEICVVVVDEFAALRRTARATLLSGRKRRSLKSDLEIRQGKVYLRVALTSSDSGFIRKIVADDGDPIAVGDLLAVVSTTDNGVLDGTVDDWKAAPTMRVVANMLQHDDDETHPEEGD